MYEVQIQKSIFSVFISELSPVYCCLVFSLVFIKFSECSDCYGGGADRSSFMGNENGFDFVVFFYFFVIFCLVFIKISEYSDCYGGGADRSSFMGNQNGF